MEFEGSKKAGEGMVSCSYPTPEQLCPLTVGYRQRVLQVFANSSTVPRHKVVCIKTEEDTENRAGRIFKFLGCTIKEGATETNLFKSF